MIVLMSAMALAADTWSEPAAGLRLLERTTSEPWRVSALEVDLCAPGVSLRATRQGERQRTTGSFLSLVGAQAAINGDFFNYNDYMPSGLAVGQGERWHDDNGTLGWVAFGADRAEISEPTTVSQPAWATQAVGGYPLLVRDGAALTTFNPAPDHCTSRHPRSAVGLSADQHTLWMVVVDGRSSSSVGMTCAELARLMRDLGAHTALNLDGGGSSTLVVEGRGAVNRPSDGSQRVVSDHLAVFADGDGAPGSCLGYVDEVVLDAAQLDRARPADLDGDGRADLCARAAAGLRCVTSTGDGFGDPWSIDAMSDANGWDDPLNHGTLRTGDVTGDGLADVCARADAGVLCWPSNGAGFDDPIQGPGLSDTSGWGVPHFATTLRLADVDGDGLDDVCAKGWSAWRCWPSLGDGFGESFDGPAWTHGSGWEQASWYGALRTGDVDGDGLDDVCGRTAAGMECWLSDGQGFPTRVPGPAWSDAAGWDAPEQWGTIRLADLDGDGMADLCGRGAEGVRCHLSEGGAFGPAIEGPTLSDAQGWGAHDNASTLRLGDIDGDGDLDLCARANVGVWCWPWIGGGFGDRVDGPALGEAEGWAAPSLYSTLRLGDVSGDGRADLCARTTEGARCWPSLGDAFTDPVVGPAWGDAQGWASPRFYTTLRLTGETPQPPVDDTDPPDDSGPPDDSAPPEGDPVGAPPGQKHDRGDLGCGCATGPEPGRALLLLVALLLVALLARRRR